MEVLILFVTLVGFGSEIEKNTDHIQILEDQIVVLEERIEDLDERNLRLSAAHSDLHARHEVDKQNFNQMFSNHNSQIEELFIRVETLQD